MQHDTDTARRTAQIALALKDTLPPEYQRLAIDLAHLIVTLPPDIDLTTATRSKPELYAALTAIDSRALVSLIGTQAGDVHLGDIAGGNMIKPTLVLSPGAAQPAWNVGVMWVIATTIGGMVGLALSYVTRLLLLARLFPNPSPGPPDALLWGIAGCVCGLLIASSQWLLVLRPLRSLLVPVIPWILFSALGYGLGSFVGTLSFNTGTLPSAMADWGTTWLALGVAQWAVLTKHGYRPTLLWAGYLVAGLCGPFARDAGEWMNSGPFYQAIAGWLAQALTIFGDATGHMVIGMVSGGICGLIAGLGTGLILATHLPRWRKATD